MYMCVAVVAACIFIHQRHISIGNRFMLYLVLLHAAIMACFSTPLLLLHVSASCRQSAKGSQTACPLPECDQA
jgi:hypothetical protein